MSGPQWQPSRRPVHLDADIIDPPRASKAGDGVLIGFAILVLLYFVGEMLRAVL